MRFKRREGQPEDASAAALDDGPSGQDLDNGSGPFDFADASGLVSEETHLDLGSLLVSPFDGAELQLQVDEASGTVMSVLLVGPGGAVELAAFAAARNSDLWDEVRREIAADATQRGGVATEQEGPFDVELACLVPIVLPDGQQLTQPSRIVGIAGPRWMLRATIVGDAAVEPDQAGVFEEVIRRVVVRRGGEAMPPGELLPLRLPPEAVAEA